jgi:hypothetical protein
VTFWGQPSFLSSGVKFSERKNGEKHFNFEEEVGVRIKVIEFRIKELRLLIKKCDSNKSDRISNKSLRFRIKQANFE